MIVSTLTTGNIIKLDATTPQILVQSSTSGGSYSEETTLGSKITISGSQGIVRVEATDSSVNAVSYLSPTGVFANRAGTQAVSAVTGYTRRGAIVGLGYGSLAASTWGANNDEAMLAGIYGRASNSTYNGAPAYGGYFYDLKACGLLLHYLLIDDNTSSYTTLNKQYSQVIGLHNSGVKYLYLPTDGYLGRVIFFHQMSGGYMRVYPGSGNVMYDDDSENSYYDCDCGDTIMAIFSKYYINGVQKNVWIVRKFRFF